MKMYSRLFLPELTDQLKGAGVLAAETGDAVNARPALPGLRVSQVGGFVESSAFDIACGGTGFILSVHVAVDLPAFRILRWALDLPWEDPEFQWLADPSERVPSDGMYQIPGCIGLKYPRDEVLNHRRLLKRGHGLDGLLLGFGFESIPANYGHGETINANLQLIDEMGRGFSSPVQFWADRSAKVRQQQGKKRRPGLLISDTIKLK